MAELFSANITPTRVSNTFMNKYHNGGVMKPTSHYTTLFLITACLLLTTAEQTYAQWSTNPVVNNAICTATGDQSSPMIVSDSSGGAIITWPDFRNGNFDIYAQRINASGTVQWTANGDSICKATGGQSSPAIVGDGSGGAIITWTDFRNGNSDIYAQRINASGTVQWTANGDTISTATGGQFSPTIVSDGTGGAIITWQDDRSGTGDYDIYAQRINASGTVQWTANGVAISTATGPQDIPTIVSDGSGGAIITWEDDRIGTNYDIYAQRINASGIVQWTANGVAISAATGTQYSPTIVSDGTGGAIIAWRDDRSGNGTSDMYAQRINTSGTVQWTANGVAICTATGIQSYLTIVSDGLSGAIITWHDDRSAAFINDIYAQRVNSSGIVQWTSNGVAICTATSDQSVPTIVSDGSGGAIITWRDSRSGINDIYARRINASGTVQWTANGVAVCTATVGRDSPTIVSDGSGGAIITWEDYRSGTNTDIYAQHIFADGALPVELVSFTAHALRSGVELSWNTATEVNNYGFEVERKQIPLNPPLQGGSRIRTADEAGGFEKLGFVEGNGTTNAPKDYSFNDKSLATGKYLYRLKQIDRDGKFEYSQSVEVAIGQTPALFELAQNYPNPFNPTTTIEFTLPEDGNVSLKIYNMLGQKVATLFDGEAKAGYIQKATFNAAQFASGVYFSRLEFGGKSLLKKIVLMK